LHWPARQDSNL